MSDRIVATTAEVVENVKRYLGPEKIKDIKGIELDLKGGIYFITVKFSWGSEFLMANSYSGQIDMNRTMGVPNV